MLYDGLFPDSGDPVASPVGTSASLDFAIRTFWPQRRVVILRDDNVGFGVDVEPELDHRARHVTLGSGGLE